jgi:hypothetical protein
MSNRMDFKAVFYNSIHDRESLIRNLDSVLGTEDYLKATVVPFASEKQPDNLFNVFDTNRRISSIRSANGIEVFQLDFDSHRPDIDSSQISGRFYIYAHPDLPKTYMLVTVESQEFWWRALSPFIQRSFPRIYLSIVNQKTMYSLLKSFQIKSEYTELRVVRAVHRSRYAWKQKNKENIIPSVSWLNLGLDGSFDFAHEQNGWFSSLTFELIQGNRILGEVTLKRNGIVKVRGGFKKVFYNLLEPIFENVHNSFKLFTGRSRKDSPALDVRPIVINFGRDQLGDLGERNRIIESLRLLDKTSTSVIHNNPYLQLSFIDYSDGSTFDIWALNPSELIIVPQLKGTVPAIRRLVSHVFDSYAEGTIEDFKVA